MRVCEALLPAPLVAFLLVVLFSTIIVRIGAKAFEKTGLSKDVAIFQATSAFTGVGFTTSEAEYITNHPVRRRIALWLMKLGSAGLTSAVASLVLTFVGNTSSQMLINGIAVLGGIGLIYLFSRSNLMDKALGKFIEWASTRWANLKIIDYEHVLGLSKGYTISIIRVKPGSWLDGKSLREAKLRDEGVVVLGVYRQTPQGEIFIGAPRPDFKIRGGDRLVCYGPEDVLEGLPERIKGPRGDLEHAIAVARQKIKEAVEEEEIKEAEIAGPATEAPSAVAIRDKNAELTA
ncbi:TrkA C-terminal domain-containing protein [Pyrofollis japonicus]|uniref:potassium channel family protein n=1 Tax=Pyrofollis japonicus TaxID=3060460 RepID=UPI00295ADB3F|nr:TrkA C-terminal domain-containing protein [Pyrofollis japonicus]BEP18091.1 TrkA C-terminal domain-containing protein [Pyrofollis japonicus]